MGIHSHFLLANKYIGELMAPDHEYMLDDQWVYVFGDQHISFEWEGREIGGDWWMLEHVAAKLGVPSQNFGDGLRIRDHFVRMIAGELEDTVVESKDVLCKSLDNCDGDENQRKVITESRTIIDRILQINEVLWAAKRLPDTHIYYYAS